jgi:hypothetical protein
MSTRIIWRSVAASALIALFTASSTVGAVAETVAAVPDNSAAAADSADTANLPDPPGRVGRLSYMDGTVSFHSQGQDQWSPATLNFPVTTGDSFWTEPNSKAEIQVGELAVRVDEKTAIDIARLDDEGTQIAVEQGTVNVTMPAMPEGGVQVLTAHGDVTLTQPGRYRIDAGEMSGDAPGPQVLVAVLDGEARVDAKSGTQVIRTGHSVTASGDPVTFAVGTAQPTDFDNWARSRDPQPAAANAAAGPAPGTNITWNTPPVVPQTPTTQYVSPDMTGYQDLQTYGSWNTVSDYGPVWYPAAVPVDWAPYRYGHWAFVAPWGWTWIDDAPWGFAPFHYGRWVFVDGRWAWWPGTVVARPVYAPALVAFIGGSGWGISLAVGGARPAVGWVPLAPHELFRPYYRATPGYVRNVNVTTVNQTVINNITVNTASRTETVNRFANRNAATVVSTTAFTSAAPAHRATVALPREELYRASTTATLRHLQPSAAARVGFAGRAVASEAPQPNAPATVARIPPGPSRQQGAAAPREAARAEAVAPGSEVPKAPGPRIERRSVTRQATAPADRTAPRPITVPQTAAPSHPAPAPAHAVREKPAAVAQPAPRPVTREQVRHPQQQTEIQATPEGWRREPRRDAAPQPQVAPQAQPPHAAPQRGAAPASTERKPGERPQRNRADQPSGG